LLIVSKKELRAGMMQVVSGDVVKVHSENPRFPRNFREAISLGNNEWILPTSNQRIAGTNVFNYNGFIFEMERTTAEDRANCQIQHKDGRLYLSILKDIEEKSVFRLLIPDSTLIVDASKYAWLKNMVGMLYEIEEECWQDGQPYEMNEHLRCQLLMNELFSHVKSFAGCEKFLKHFETNKFGFQFHEPVKTVSRMLRACIDVMNDDNVTGLSEPLVINTYPIYPLNHLHFTCIRKQFKFRPTLSYSDV
jgi:hypothetical protein